MARTEHSYDRSPLPCDPINSSPRWGPLSSPGPQRACDQRSPSEGDASQSQQILRFATPGGLPKENTSWADNLTPQGLILHPSRDEKASKVSISLTSGGNFSQVPGLYWLLLSGCMPLHICYSKSERNAAFLGVWVSRISKYSGLAVRLRTYRYKLT